MNEDKLYKQHFIINGVLLVLSLGITIAVIVIPWPAGAIHSITNTASLVALAFSYYKLPLHETRLLLRVFITMNLIFLAIATPIAYR